MLNWLNAAPQSIVRGRPWRRWSRIGLASLCFIGASVLFGYGLGLAFFAEIKGPWVAAVAFGLWGVAGLLLWATLHLAGFWGREE